MDNLICNETGVERDIVHLVRVNASWVDRAFYELSHEVEIFRLTENAPPLCR